MSERIKVNVKVSSEISTILHDLFNQIQYEFCEQYEEEIKRLNNKVEELMTLYTTERNVKEDYKTIIKEAREFINNYNKVIRKNKMVGEFADFMIIPKELLEILKGE